MNRIRASLPILLAGLLAAAPIAAQTEGTAQAEAASKADARLEAAAKKVDAKANAGGEVAVAGRLAARFGGTTEAMLAEQERLDVSWGQLMIAHALEKNVAATWTVDQVVALRRDGTGWGQVAADLGLELGSVIKSADREGRVATGQLATDTRFELMQGRGATAGLNAETRGVVGVGAAGAATSATSGLGAGVGLKVGR